MLKDYLKEHKIAFTEVVLDKEPEQIHNFLETCQSRGVPCTHITKDDGTEVKILGFDKPQVDAALGINA